MSPDCMSPYLKAQIAIAYLKAAVLEVIKDAPDAGLKNVEIGRKLGIYMGHVKHEGHIPRTILAMMEAEGVVEQCQSDKLWKLTSAADGESR